MKAIAISCRFQKGKGTIRRLDVKIGDLYLLAAAECELRARLGVLLGRGSWLTELSLGPCNKEVG